MAPAPPIPQPVPQPVPTPTPAPAPLIVHGVAFDQGGTPTIACINKANDVAGFRAVDFGKLVAALQVFVDKHFAPIWGAPCKLMISTGFVPAAWAIIFTDTADVAGALGYHDVTPEGLPLSHIFTQTTVQNGDQVSVTASHELAEMLVDPGIQMASLGPKNIWYAYETADAVERLSFRVDGIAMTDFVYPSWFEGFRQPGSDKFDYMGRVTAPFQILPGGYMPIWTARTGWTQTFGSREAAARFAGEDRRYHRTERRAKKYLEAELALPPSMAG